MDKDYNPFSKFKSLISPKDHIGAAWSYIDFDKDGDDDFIVATQPDNSEIEQTNHIYLIKNDGGNFSLWKTLNGFVFPSDEDMKNVLDSTPFFFVALRWPIRVISKLFGIKCAEKFGLTYWKFLSKRFAGHIRSNTK